MSLESDIAILELYNDGMSLSTSTTFTDMPSGWYFITSLGSTCTFEISHDGVNFYTMGQTLEDGETGEIFIPTNIDLKLEFSSGTVEVVRQRGRSC